MSPAHVLEPTYEAIKRRVIEGHWPPGFRLDTARLAGDLGVSKSPVRDSLNRLAGERKIDFTPGHGFRVGIIDEKQLRDMLDLNMHLLLATAYGELRITNVASAAAGDHAARTAACFSRLAQEFGNHELECAIAALNDRLLIVRRLEPAVLKNPAAALDALEQALTGGDDPSAIRCAIAHYHVERKLVAGQFARILATEDDGHGNIP